MCVLEFTLNDNTADAMRREAVKFLRERMSAMMVCPEIRDGEDPENYGERVAEWSMDERRRLSIVIYRDWANALANAIIKVSPAET